MLFPVLNFNMFEKITTFGFILRIKEHKLNIVI